MQNIVVVLNFCVVMSLGESVDNFVEKWGIGEFW